MKLSKLSDAAELAESLESISMVIRSLRQGDTPEISTDGIFVKVTVEDINDALVTALERHHSLIREKLIGMGVEIDVESDLSAAA
jgi:hypothetical protein